MRWAVALVLASCLLFRGDNCPGALIALYEFNGNTTDSVRGATGAGAVTGSAAYAAGVTGQAFSFNGSTYFRAPVAGAGLSAFSFSAWVKFNNLNAWSTIVKNWGQLSGAFHLGLDQGSSAGKISNYMGINGGQSSPVVSGSMSTNTWYHVGVAYGSGTQILYINGAQVASGSATGTINNRYADMTMGVKLNDAQTAPANDPGWLNGYLDDVAFFDNKLTAAEMMSVYTSGSTTGGSIADAYAVPEPGSASLLILGLAAILAGSRRCKSSAV
jgi:hypothetical protein